MSRRYIVYRRRIPANPALAPYNTLGLDHVFTCVRSEAEHMCYYTCSLTQFLAIHSDTSSVSALAGRQPPPASRDPCRTHAGTYIWSKKENQNATGTEGF